MKYILVALLVIHGLIHLLGFVKAFDLAQPAQLQAPISRPLGILWLSAALLLVVAAGCFGRRLVANSDDRYRTADGKQYERLRWSTPVQGWREVDGRKVFSGAEAVWQLPTGEFAYGRFDFAEIQYNVLDDALGN